MAMDNSVVTAGRKSGVEVEESIWGINGDKKKM